MKASTSRRWQRGTLSATRTHWTLRIRRDSEGGKRREQRIRIGTRTELRTRREARAAADVVAEQLTGAGIAAGRTIGAVEYLERYLRSRAALKRASTAATAGTIIRRHLIPMAEGRRLDEIGNAEAQRLIEGLAIVGAAPEYSRAIVRQLRMVLRAAAAEGFACRSIDIGALTFASSRRAAKAPPSFTAAEISRLVNGTPLPWCLAYAIAATLGLRGGELLGLTWSDLDLEGQRVQIRRAAVRGRLGPLKSEGSRATLPLPSDLCDRLRAFRESWRPNPEGLLFATRNGRAPHLSHLWRRLRADLARLGLPHRGTHALRHTAASLLVASGISPAAARDLLRHSDIRTTGRYMHGSRDDVRRGVEILGNALREASK